MTGTKPYTEDTLLSAMEHAGMENYDDDTEKKGLGTPATRAATIEGLVLHGYAERKGKQITATEKGVSLIEVVPNEVKSPKLTADWEMQLQQIERGEFSGDVFMQGIDNLIEKERENAAKAEQELANARAELSAAADIYTSMEKLLGGTYIQALVGEEREKRESDIIPNGLKNA